ncbi:tail protein [[Actinobacillus] muris]|uniref:Tail protein n=1 Tax=Muribacter muris TaxID=67855 RepID=A0A0J5P1S6_9PAST|nr:phage virion morphogenesis protein [Muribacter muris]KMK50478.1 tail protein [[Actinobacillus] muris] [Muribacter muris]
MTIIDTVTPHLQALVQQLSPQQRKALTREIGKQLAQSQRKRIAAQKNPDGTPYAPRKVQKRVKRGKVKQKAMFAKLRTARLMKTRTNGDGVEIGYAGQAGFIADIHQHGKSSRVLRHLNWKVKYDQRELLGFSGDDQAMIENIVLAHLAYNKKGG